MIIKSHIRGGFRSAADYLKSQGENEKIRTVEISDPDATNLDQAFHNMWAVAQDTRAKKPLHHISINPYKDERLTDDQVLKIVERCEQKYGYKPGDHQRVIVEHIKDRRQHFHVIWSRISLNTGKAVWPGLHWNKSKQVAREMEKKLGLKQPMPKRMKRARKVVFSSSRICKISGRYRGLSGAPALIYKPLGRITHGFAVSPLKSFRPYMRGLTRRKKKGDENIPDSEKMQFRRPEWETAELLAWAWENGRTDILAQFGVSITPDMLE